MFIDVLFLQILCVEGVEFEPFPTGLSLPPKAGPHTVILLGIPQSVGQLRITGQCEQAPGELRSLRSPNSLSEFDI